MDLSAPAQHFSFWLGMVVLWGVWLYVELRRGETFTEPLLSGTRRHAPRRYWFTVWFHAFLLLVSILASLVTGARVFAT